MKLEGKRALITGADSGIGQAIAEKFAQAGADVAIVFHTDREGAEATRRRVEQAGRKATVYQADAGDSAAVDQFFMEAVQALGGVDILVSNAGVGMGGTEVADLSDEQLSLVLRTDLMAPLFCARAFIRHRRQQGGPGKIINISSVAQHLPTPGSAPYGMAKAGVGSLMRSLSRELAEDKINVNNIAPGLTETPMTKETLDDPEKRQQSFDKIPWHRAGKPEEIAGVALFLASADADYVTGQTWTIDGGLTMQWGGA